MRVSEEYAGVSHVGSMREISQDSPGLNRQTVAKRKRNRITLCNWGTIEKTLHLFFFIFFSFYPRLLLLPPDFEIEYCAQWLG